MAISDHRFSIANLGDCEHWLPQVANWLHIEWLRARGDHHPDEGHNPALLRRLHEREEALKRHLGAEPLPVTFVAHDDWNQPVGVVSLVFYQVEQTEAPSEWLTNLYVLPRYRRRGIAQRLLNHAIAYARDCNLQRLLLYTSDQVDFYGKRQWRVIGKGVVSGRRVDIMDYQLR